VIYSTLDFLRSKIVLVCFQVFSGQFFGVSLVMKEDVARDNPSYYFLFIWTKLCNLVFQGNIKLNVWEAKLSGKIKIINGDITGLAQFRDEEFSCMVCGRFSILCPGW
jgi:hypothetical protein